MSFDLDKEWESVDFGGYNLVSVHLSIYYFPLNILNRSLFSVNVAINEFSDKSSDSSLKHYKKSDFNQNGAFEGNELSPDGVYLLLVEVELQSTGQRWIGEFSSTCEGTNFLITYVTV